MTVYLGIVSQKGGVGKSTLARMMAREYAAAGWEVKIADMDIGQGTSFDWSARRLQNGFKPDIAVEKFGSVEQATKVSSIYDLMIFDGAPHATEGTLRIAGVSTLLILPTFTPLDDLKPQVLLAHELRKKGIERSKIMFALCRVGDSKAEIEDAREYIESAGYTVLKGMLPQKTGFSRASDEGKSPTETPFSSLNKKAGLLAQGIINSISEHMKETEKVEVA